MWNTKNFQKKKMSSFVVIFTFEKLKNMWSFVLIVTQKIE